MVMNVVATVVNRLNVVLLVKSPDAARLVVSDAAEGCGRLEAAEVAIELPGAAPGLAGLLESVQPGLDSQRLPSVVPLGA